MLVSAGINSPLHCQSKQHEDIPALKSSKPGCKPAWTSMLVCLFMPILIFSILLLYVQYPEQPVCTSLLFTLLFIKSQYTVFFAHLIVFCTSYCFAHLIALHFLFHCTFYSYFSFLPYICSCVVLLYIIFIFIILHCPLSGPDSITFHF